MPQLSYDYYPRAFRRKSGDYVIPFAVRPSVRPSVCQSDPFTFRSASIFS